MDEKRLYDYSEEKQDALDLISLLQWYVSCDKEEIPSTLFEKCNFEISKLKELLFTLQKAYYYGSEN